MIPTHCPFCNLLLEELFAQGEDTNNWVCPTRLGPNNYYWHYAICLDHDEKWDGHVLTYERIHLGTKGSASRLTFFTPDFTGLDQDRAVLLPAVKVDVTDAEAIINKLKLLTTFL